MLGRIREMERELGIGASSLRRDVLVQLLSYADDPQFAMGCSAEMLALDLDMRLQTVRLILRHFLASGSIEAAAVHHRTRFFRLTSAVQHRVAAYVALHAAGERPDQTTA